MHASVDDDMMHRLVRMPAKTTRRCMSVVSKLESARTFAGRKTVIWLRIGTSVQGGEARVVVNRKREESFGQARPDMEKTSTVTKGMHMHR